MWVSRVIASKYKKERVYVVLNGYRWDDFNAYAYVSEDYGENWRQIGTDLPMEPANVIKEDPDNEDIIYVGTDHGLYVSLDRGAKFMLMNNGIPAVPVHDVVIHPREKDIIVGTHGRSIYVGSGKELQQLKEEMIAKTIHAFAMDGMRSSGFWGRKRANWSTAFEPSTSIPFYAKDAGKATISVMMGEDLVLREMEVDASIGLNFADFDLTIDMDQMEAYETVLNEKKKKNAAAIKLKAADNGKIYLKGGKYTIKVEKDGQSSSTSLNLR